MLTANDQLKINFTTVDYNSLITEYSTFINLLNIFRKTCKYNSKQSDIIKQHIALNLFQEYFVCTECSKIYDQVEKSVHSYEKY